MRFGNYLSVPASSLRAALHCTGLCNERDMTSIETVITTARLKRQKPPRDSDRINLQRFVGKIKLALTVKQQTNLTFCQLLIYVQCLVCSLPYTHWT